MSLTGPERQRLEEIEQSLVTESPQFAELFVPSRLHEQSRAREEWRRFGLTAALAGMALNIAGAAFGLGILIIASAVVILLSSLAAWYGLTVQPRRARRLEPDPEKASA